MVIHYSSLNGQRQGSASESQPRAEQPLRGAQISGQAHGGQHRTALCLRSVSEGLRVLRVVFSVGLPKPLTGRGLSKLTSAQRQCMWLEFSAQPPSPCSQGSRRTSWGYFLRLFGRKEFKQNCCIFSFFLWLVWPQEIGYYYQE